MPSIHLADSSNRINGVRSSLRHTDAAKRTESGKELTPISRSNRQPYPTITVTEAQQGNLSDQDIAPIDEAKECCRCGTEDFPHPSEIMRRSLQSRLGAVQSRFSQADEYAQQTEEASVAT